MSVSMTPEFAEIMGAFVGDGWISKSTGYTLVISGDPKKEVSYYERLASLFNFCFNLNLTPRNFYYWGTYGIMVTRKAIICEFLDKGFNIGKKAHIVRVPSVILNNRKYWIPFIRGYFDTDGCIYFQKSYNSNASVWQKANKHRSLIEFTTVSKNLADEVYFILSKLGFNFMKKKPYIQDKSAVYKLRLDSKSGVIRFFELICPSNEKHIKKFKYWLDKGFY